MTSPVDIDGAMEIVSPEAAEVGHASPGRRREDEISLIEALAWLRRRGRLITAAALVAAMVSVVRALLSPVTYTATASFMPFDGSASASGPGGGASVGGSLLALIGGRTDHTSFYADLTRSRSILREVAGARYTYGLEEGERISGSLVEFLGGDGSREVAEKRVVAALGDMIKTEVQGAQVVAIEVAAPAPELAEQIAGELIRVVDEWNRDRRQTQATIERDFVAASVERARSELLEAEAELETWLEQNVRFEGSSRKVFEYDRLSRRVDLKQSVYLSLAQALEQARINAVRNTPVIAILDAPESELEPNGRGVVPRGLMGLVFGAGLGFVLAFASDWLGSGGRQDRLARAWRTRLRRPI